MSTTGDEEDDGLPDLHSDVVSTGAAADSADWDERTRGLPRILRYATLVSESAEAIEKRLIAEIDELCPRLAETAGWAVTLDTDAGLALAAQLDHKAAAENEPGLRGLADCVRLLCLPVPRHRRFFENYRRVAKALVWAFRSFVRRDTDPQLCCILEQFTFGWAALPGSADLFPGEVSAALTAKMLGRIMAEQRVSEARAAVRRRMKEEQERRKEEEAESKAAAPEARSLAAETTPDHHIVVARLSDTEMKSTKLRDIIGPLKSVINVPLPLVEAPPLYEVRRTLAFEFPYALDVIDFVLADLVGRTTVHLRALLLVGDPGGGKTRFARRLGETLGVTVWRTDASRSDGAVFGGTDRRWYSAEPCHPFLAIAQGKIANPLVLIDEIEKAGTRSDYGRLWDCLLGFLEAETNCRYPDPALQTNIDLSHVSYLATANSIDPLPSPIRDRFRVVTFPKPRPEDIDALLPEVIADLAKDRGVDARWVQPLDGFERMAAARHWRGGSVRRLRRIVEAILRERDLTAARH